MIAIAVVALLMGLLRLRAHINAGVFDSAIFTILLAELLTFASEFFLAWHEATRAVLEEDQSLQSEAGTGSN